MLEAANKEAVMHVEQVMTRDVVTVSPDTLLKEVAELLAERSISGVPVCDDERHVLGVVSENDILYKELGPDQRQGGPFAWLLEPATGSSTLKIAARTAEEAMTAPAIAIEPGRPVSEAARTMIDRGVNRLPVVADGVLVGIVTRADLVRTFQRSDAEILDEIRGEVLVRTLWIDPEPITVEVDRGEVKLAGEVETRTTAELLAAFVRRVPGVVSVESELSWKVDDLARRTGKARVPARV
jgi:CBS domain-containing protein